MGKTENLYSSGLITNEKKKEFLAFEIHVSLFSNSFVEETLLNFFLAVSTFVLTLEALPPVLLVTTPACLTT